MIVKCIVGIVGLIVIVVGVVVGFGVLKYLVIFLIDEQ